MALMWLLVALVRLKMLSLKIQIFHVIIEIIILKFAVEFGLLIFEIWN